jgi:hypothetical protein
MDHRRFFTEAVREVTEERHFFISFQVKDAPRQRPNGLSYLFFGYLARLIARTSSSLLSPTRLITSLTQF